MAQKGEFLIIPLHSTLASAGEHTASGAVESVLSLHLSGKTTHTSGRLG